MADKKALKNSEKLVSQTQELYKAICKEGESMLNAINEGQDALGTAAQIQADLINDVKNLNEEIEIGRELEKKTIDLLIDLDNVEKTISVSPDIESSKNNIFLSIPQNISLAPTEPVSIKKNKQHRTHEFSVLQKIPDIWDHMAKEQKMLDDLFAEADTIVEQALKTSNTHLDERNRHKGTAVKSNERKRDKKGEELG